jgi:hypothetical protein
MIDQPHDVLDRQLLELQRDVAPPSDLWPRIARDAARAQRKGGQDAARPGVARPSTYVAAAAIACVSLVGALTWVVVHGLPNRAGADRTAPAAVQLPAMVSLRANGYGEPHDPEYVAARTGLEHTFRERLALLEPGTRVQIEASLTVIQAAHADIVKALAAEPSNPVLEQLLESTWHDEFDLYEHVVRSTQPTFTRI